jgi:hypothetical protein
MTGEVHERPIVDHEPVQVLAGDCGLHAVVEDFGGCPKRSVSRFL